MTPSDDAKVILGIWQQLPSPMVSRFLARMGWDWVILDLQHGALGPETAYECIHTLRGAGVTPLVRVGIGDTFGVQRALDLGASGVIVPLVNSPADARAMAEAAKYPPKGARSIGGDMAYHAGADYVDRANAETLLLVQIEHIQAVRQVEEILAIDGVDGTFLGPTDLALSMGLGHRDFENNPEHRAAIRRTLEAGRALGKLVACNTYSQDDARAKLAEGFRCITLRSDADLFFQAGTAALGELRNSVDSLK